MCMWAHAIPCMGFKGQSAEVGSLLPLCENLGIKLRPSGLAACTFTYSVTPPTSHLKKKKHHFLISCSFLT